MTYKLLKRVIENKSYVKEDILLKLDMYLAFDRITNDEYSELAEIVNSEN